jgi:hypothetical protein
MSNLAIRFTMVTSFPKVAMFACTYYLRIFVINLAIDFMVTMMTLVTKFTNFPLLPWLRGRFRSVSVCGHFLAYCYLGMTFIKALGCRTVW